MSDPMSPLTPDELAALRAEHTPQAVPPCRVCGRKMTYVGRDSAECTVSYGCEIAIDPKITPGWREHYIESLVRLPANPDPRILRLLDAYESLRRQLAEMVCR